MSKRCKDKGPGFERKACRMWRDWWGKGIFDRTKNLQVKGRIGRGIYGDVVCLTGETPPNFDIMFPFSVECKCQEDWEFADLLKDNAGGIHPWWHQCRTDADRWKKIPLLMFKKNYSPIYVMVPSTTIYLPPIVKTRKYGPKHCFHLCLDHDTLLICTWEAFQETYIADWSKTETAT